MRQVPGGQLDGDLGLDDGLLLVENILASLDGQKHPEVASLRTPEFFQELMRHSWPGNVRELRNYIERCLALRMRTPLTASTDGAVANDGARLDDLPFISTGCSGATASAKTTRRS